MLTFLSDSNVFRRLSHKVFVCLATVGLALAAIVSPVHGQDQNSGGNGEKAVKRPRIGLVLSGGGARGFAHVGVLRALEENHIPVDYIAGASMGALVGAVYATGRSPDEMESLLKALNWAALLRGKPGFDDLSYRRKQDRRSFPGSVKLSGNKINDLKLPSSLNPGHEIGLLLDRLMLPYDDTTDFDDLPIPFRCVATDMVKAETVVLKSGSLAESLRATMAIPAVFAPVELNGRILADGGILDNIPTDVAKDMGADIVLVVNIETPIGDRSQLQDLVGILGQTFYVATVENSRRSLRQADFIIAPDLANYGSFDFGDAEKIMKLGYDGATSKLQLLKGLALDDTAWQEYLADKRSRKKPDTLPIPEFLAIQGTENASAIRRIEQKIDGKYNGRPLDTKGLESDLTALTGTERFDNIGYGTTKKAGKEGLTIRVYDPRERTGRTTVLDAGLNVNNAENDDVNFNARARLTVFDFLGDRNEWQSDLSIGSRVHLGTELYHPFGQSRFFLAPYAAFDSHRVNFYQEGDRLAEYNFNTTQVGIDAGYDLSRNSEFRIGYSIGHQRATRRIGNPLFGNLSGKVSFTSVKWNFDTRNDAQVPTAGIEFRNTFNYYFDTPGENSGFPQAETDLSAFHLISDKNLVFGFGGGGSSFGRTAPLFQQFTLGGLFNVGGYGSGEFRGSNYAHGGLGLLRHVSTAPAYIGGKIYFGGWYEGGTAFENWSEARYRQSVTGGVLVETRIGPIFLGGSYANGGRKKFYFSLGRFF